MADIPANLITGATLNSVQNEVIENRTQINQNINLLPTSFIKSVQRGVTILGMNVSSLAITLLAVDPAKTIVNLLGYRNQDYPTYRADLYLSNATTLTVSAQATGYQVNSMRVSWEVIEFV